jgi:pimeloyl-ACP methyl ester carboxylesterase
MERSSWNLRRPGWWPWSALAVVAIVASVAIALSSGSAPAREDGAATGSLRACASARGVRPTVVLVHGAWADTSSWAGEVAALHRAGYAARAIGNPVENLTSDAAQVAGFVRSVRGPVVLVGHSYGGAVITNAAAGLSNVKALVYVDAAAPAPGEANKQLSGATSVLATLPPSRLFETVGSGAGTALYLKRDVFVRRFAPDLPPARAEALWAAQRGAAPAAFATPSTAAAWRTIPSWAFISTGDQIITPASELAMARRAGARVTVFHGGSHLTLISHPDAVTHVIAQAICSVRGQRSELGTASRAPRR